MLTSLQANYDSQTDNRVEKDTYMGTNSHSAKKLDDMTRID